MFFYVFIFLLFFVPVSQNVAFKYFRKIKPRPILVALMSALIMYVFIQFFVFVIERNLQAELDAFDLNGDGFFSGEEMTPEQDAAMMRVVSDTARNLAPITGGIFCFLYFIVLYLLLKVAVWCKQIDDI